MKQLHRESNRRSPSGDSRRRGIATVWLILWGPVLLVLFCITLDLANLWIARIELRNALDGASQATVKHWGDGGTNSTDVPRKVGVAFADANTILGNPLAIASNYGPGNLPNENLECDGDLVFGSVVNQAAPFDFRSDVSPACAPGKVFIQIEKQDAGGGNPNQSEPVHNDMIYIEFQDDFIDDDDDDDDDDESALEIRSISFTIPDFGVQNNKQPFFAGDKTPQVGTTSGINPGDVSFSFSDGFSDDRYRTITLTFAAGTFKEGDWMHFGVSVNKLKPPVLSPGTKNNGEAWHIAPVAVSVTFYNSETNTTTIANGIFIDDKDGPNNDIAIADISGGSAKAAVHAQASVQVSGFCTTLLGIPDYTIYGDSTAVYDCGTGKVQLIRIRHFLPACP